MQAHIMAILTAVCLSDGSCCSWKPLFSVGQAIKTNNQAVLGGGETDGNKVETCKN